MLIFFALLTVDQYNLFGPRMHRTTYPRSLFCTAYPHIFANYTIVHPGLCSQEEERLVRDLFRGYNKLIRPVQNMTEKVDVAFGLAFIQLINVVSANLATLYNLSFRFLLLLEISCNLYQLFL